MTETRINVVGARFGGKVSKESLLANAMSCAGEMEFTIVISKFSTDGRISVGWSAGIDATTLAGVLGVAHQQICQQIAEGQR